MHVEAFILIIRRRENIMSEEFNANNIEEVLRSGAKKAEDYLKNQEGLEALLQKLEATMKDIPYVGESASRLPLMISMIRSYILQEYTEVSPRVIGSLVGLVLYLTTSPPSLWYCGSQNRI